MKNQIRTTKKLDLQKAAEKYGKKLEKEKDIAQLKQRLYNVSKDQESLLKDLNQIKYSLKIAYNTKIANIKKEIDDYNTQLICLSDIKQGSVINSFDLNLYDKNKAKYDYTHLYELCKQMNAENFVD